MTEFINWLDVHLYGVFPGEASDWDPLLLALGIDDSSHVLNLATWLPEQFCCQVGRDTYDEGRLFFEELYILAQFWKFHQHNKPHEYDWSYAGYLEYHTLLHANGLRFPSGIRLQLDEHTAKRTPRSSLVLTPSQPPAYTPHSTAAIPVPNVPAATSYRTIPPTPVDTTAGFPSDVSGLFPNPVQVSPSVVPHTSPLVAPPPEEVSPFDHASSLASIPSDAAPPD